MVTKKNQWFVYMVRCRKGALYTGITTDVDKRIQTHNSGKGSKAVRALGLPVTLATRIPAPNKSKALKMEARIKKLPKKYKELVSNFPHSWKSIWFVFDLNFKYSRR